MKVAGDSVEEATKTALELAPDVVGLSLMCFEAPGLSTLAALLFRMMLRN
jgi:hypothetical protein